MRFPHRSSRSIPHQSLPSIQTLFRSSLNDGTRAQSPLLGSPGKFVDGIEVVPLERQNSSTTKICTPGTEEKEVVVGWKKDPELELELAAKPLPSLPRSRWARMSTKHRIIGILGLQFLLLLTIGLGLMAAGGKKSEKHDPSVVQLADPRTPPTILPIQSGTFILPIDAPQQQTSACLAQNNESAAWTCTSHKSLLFSFLQSPAKQKNLTIMSIGSTSGVKPSTYGILDPEIDSLELTPAVDPEQPSNGAAYYFRTTYSRTVLLKGNQMVAQSQDLGLLGTSVSTIEAGDRPWLCVFNETRLEGYIYVSKNSTCSNEPVVPGSRNSTVTFHIPCLPYVMKLTEQSVPNSTQPYCSRMMVGSDGSLVNDGASKMLKLSEVDSVPHAPGNSTVAKLVAEKRQQISSSKTCRCQWMVQ